MTESNQRSQSAVSCDWFDFSISNTVVISAVSYAREERLHFLICAWCQRYEEQLHYIHQTAGQFPEHTDEASDILFPPDAKERIKEKLTDRIQ